MVLANNPTLAAMHAALESEETCQAKPDWNSYVCPLRDRGNFLSTFWIESLDADAFDRCGNDNVAYVFAYAQGVRLMPILHRYMGPIWFTLETGQGPPAQANAVYGKEDDSGMHMAR